MKFFQLLKMGHHTLLNIMIGAHKLFNSSQKSTPVPTIKNDSSLKCLSNIARHKRKCALTNELKTEYCKVDKIGGKCDTFKCDMCNMCGEERRKPNKSRDVKLHEKNEHYE